MEKKHIDVMINKNSATQDIKKSTWKNLLNTGITIVKHRIKDSGILEDVQIKTDIKLTVFESKNQNQISKRNVYVNSKGFYIMGTSTDAKYSKCKGDRYVVYLSLPKKYREELKDRVDEFVDIAILEKNKAKALLY